MTSQKPKLATTISGFVRDTLGNGKKSDHKSILDFFSGDESKVDRLLERIESATMSPHPLSRSSTSQLLSAAEWHNLLENIKLRCPNLSRNHKKTLKAISQRLTKLREHEDLTENNNNTQDLDQMWSQALRQPSDQLTAEDIKLLYDLKDEDTSEISEDYASDDARPYSVTLSQVLDPNRDSQQTEESVEEEEEAVETQSLENSEIQKATEGDQFALPELETISDSESEPEELNPDELIEYLKPYDPLVISQPITLSSLGEDHRKPEDISSHQMHESFDILTSISFPPTFKKTESRAQPTTQVKESALSLPNKTDLFKAPQRWPSNLVITSSPPSENTTSPQRKESPFFSALESPIKRPQGSFEIRSSPSEIKLSPEAEVLNSRSASTKLESFLTRNLDTAEVHVAEELCSKSESIKQSMGNIMNPEMTDASMKYLNFLKDSPQNSADSWHFPPNKWETDKDSQDVFQTAPTGSYSKEGNALNGVGSLVLSPRKRTKYITSVVEVHGIGICQKDTAELKIATASVPVLDDVIPDSEDDSGEVSMIEITRQVEEPVTQNSVLQVPSSPGV